jgi:hypothetical protein
MKLADQIEAYLQAQYPRAVLRKELVGIAFAHYNPTFIQECCQQLVAQRRARREGRGLYLPAQPWSVWKAGA